MAVSKAIVFFALSLSSFVQATFGGITCESLDQSTCAFAVSSSATRCLLEKRMPRGGQVELFCCSSEIETDGSLMNWLESDTCIEACGLDRNTMGISTDGLLDGKFIQKLCSSQCYNGCPNIVELYFNLAVGEGVFLPKLCEEQTVNAAKVMAAIRSSGAAAVSEVHESDVGAVTDDAAAVTDEFISAGAASDEEA